MVFGEIMSSLESLRSMLSNDNSRTIVRYCKEPRGAAEIIQHLAKSSSTSQSKDYWERVVSDLLPNLDKYGALVYASGKWHVTQAGKDVLEKYFGGL